jgi:L-ascorbate metabolism protein UlaG (beta-lactamase superfamily)
VLDQAAIIWRWIVRKTFQSSAGQQKISPRTREPEANGEQMSIDSSEMGGDFRVSFLGVSTLLFTDGKNAFLTDGFFSRPDKLRFLFTKIDPNRKIITQCLDRAGIKSLDAVIVVHSHFDHVMDAPIIAAETGAQLMGSESTKNVALGYIERGLNLPEKRITTIEVDQTINIGEFRITPIVSSHVPSLLAPKHEIKAPLRPPVYWRRYKEGVSYSLLISHGAKTMLVQGSAGFVRNALKGRHADIVFLGIAQLGRQNDAYRDEYWREVVKAVTASRVIPIHWDDLWRPLSRPLVPLPRYADNFDKAMRFLLERANQDGIEITFLPAWKAVNPFAGLEETVRTRN